MLGGCFPSPFVAGGLFSPIGSSDHRGSSSRAFHVACAATVDGRPRADAKAPRRSTYAHRPHATRTLSSKAPLMMQLPRIVVINLPDARSRRAAMAATLGA